MLSFGLIVAISAVGMEKEQEEWRPIPLSDAIYLPTGDRICCTCNPNRDLSLMVFDSNDHSKQYLKFNLNEFILPFQANKLSNVRVYGIGTLLDNSVLTVILAKNKLPDDVLIYIWG